MKRSGVGGTVLAILAGVVVNVVLSLATDQVLHVTGIYPPWGEPMYEPSLNALALSYRIVFAVLAGYVTARLAPSAPMRHVQWLAGLGFALAVLGIGAAAKAQLGPLWYPVALAVLTFPAVYAGGVLERRRVAGVDARGDRRM